MMIHSLNRVKIDLPALTHNLGQVKKLIAPETKIMGIVKSDAYGHGLLPVSQVLEREGIDYLGVAQICEALELRKRGIRTPIAILCGIQTREEAAAAVDKNLTPVLFDPSPVDLLAEESARRGKRAHIQLKVDTGMGRLGIAWGEAGTLIKKTVENKDLFLEALLSHLSSADDPAGDFTETQINNFSDAIGMGRQLGLDLPLNSLANSAGIMAHKDSHLDMVRPGIMLYGGLPSPGFAGPLPLKPVMNFTGKVLQVRDLPDNSPVSYGRTYYTKGPEKIAVLSAGYGDGVPRMVSTRGKVLISGKKLNIIGRVCMNMIVAHVSGLEDIKTGDEAVFLGRQGDETITGDDMARWGETISYEIFCSIGQRNAKEYSNSK